MKLIITTLAMLLTSGANANSILFDMADYSGTSGDQISVTINYDFTDDAMFGGGLNLYFDANVISFVSFTQGPVTGAPSPSIGVYS